MRFVCVIVLLIVGSVSGMAAPEPKPVSPASASRPANDDPERLAQLILEGAKREAAKATPYVEEYQILDYPGGDVPKQTGVCTDLVIRAFRNAGVDLQVRLHEDRVAHPEAYPTQIWDHKKADKNIDHRRCQNLAVPFKRFAKSLSIRTDGESLKQWQPGDVVFYIAPKASHPWHVAIVSDKKDRDGMPFIIDSYYPRTSESHRLDAWAPIHSHFRYTRSKDNKAGNEGPNQTNGIE